MLSQETSYNPAHHRFTVFVACATFLLIVAGALVTVIAQGILGGLTVLFYLPAPISSAHAALAQTFFCIAVCMALFTSRKWVEQQPAMNVDVQHPRLLLLTVVSVLVLYV